MDIYKLFYMFLLCCMMHQGSAWFGSRDRSSSRETSRQSSGSSRGSGSRRSGWWGGGRNRPSKSSSVPKPKPKPKPPARPAPKPRPKPEGKRTSRWWSRTDRNVPPKPKSKPNPKPKKTPEPKPRSSGWWASKGRNVPPKPKPKPVTKPRQSPKPKPKQNKQQETDIKKVIEKYEGTELKAYDAQPDNPKYHDTTVGIGFNMKRKGARKTFEKILPGVDFDNVKSGKQSITKKQARALFENDVDKKYEPRAKNKIGKSVYNKLPSNVKAAVVNAVYRGDLGPKTSELIKKGKWNEVGKEYLDHEQYRNADTLGISGIKTRMDWNKEQFDTMIKSNKAN